MINLIPPERKKRQKIRSKAYFIVLIYIIASSIVVLGWVAQTSLNFVAKSNISNKESELAQLDSQINKNKDLISKAEFIQDRINSAPKFQQNYDWNELLNAVSASVPTDTVLTNLVIASDEVKTPILTISGKSASRRSIILFQEKLSKNELFTNANLSSIADTVEETTTTYSFTLSAGVKEQTK